MVKVKNNEMDMCNGPLVKKIVFFTIPLVLTMILQQLFNTTDLVVVGSFGHEGALAAVGANTSLINLLINLFNGLSIGAGVIVARCYGTKGFDRVKKCVSTSVAISLVIGTFLAVFAIVFSKPILLLMGTPQDVLYDAVLYLRIYFLGMPFMMLYNFCASILRAVGDSKRTLYYISAAGVINVILNLVFIIIFDMNVAGVAAATAISQIVSSMLCIRYLVRYDGHLKLDLKSIRVDFKELKQIMIIGVPASIQGTMFSLSNLIIQSSVNSFGSVVMSGSTAAGNIEGYVFFAMNGFSSATTTFASQNFGAGKFDRIKRVLFICLGFAFAIGVVFGIGGYAIGPLLLTLYTDVPDEIKVGMTRFTYILMPYAACGIMDVLASLLRGIGHTVFPAVNSIICVCVIRIVWVYTIFAYFKTLESLYISYIISWTLAIIPLTAMIIYSFKKFKKHSAKEI